MSTVPSARDVVSRPPAPAPVVCAGCACLCDDVRVERSNGRIDAVQVNCDPGRRFLSALGELEPRALIAGKPSALPAAVAAAAQLLRSAKSPAILGLARLTVEAVRETVALAETLGGLLAPWPADPARHWGLIAPDPARTFGEIRNRADLVVFWRCDPMRTHPRHLERISASPRGRFLPRGRADRTLIVVDEPGADNQTAAACDAALRIPRAGDLDRLMRLRLHLEKGEPAPVEFVPLIAALTKAKYAHIFLDGVTAEDAVLMQQFQMLAANRHAKVRMGLSMLGATPHRRGATEVLIWQTGFPGPLSFASGAPAYRPGAWDADRVLIDGLCDVVVCAGLDGVTGGTDIPVCQSPGLPEPALAALAQTRRIVFASTADPTAAVSFVVPGLDPRLDAHVIRSDGIMLRLCGGAGAGTPDPTAGLLHEIRAALGGPA